MTKSSNNPGQNLIRGAKVSGVVFCSPSGQIEKEDQVAKQEQENLKALEDFWRSKGLQEGRAQGYEEGLKEGEERGYKKGLHEGQTQGSEEGYAKGLEEGKEQGVGRAQEEYTEALELAQRLATEVGQEKEELLEKFKPEILKFSIALCETVLRCELTNPDVLKKVVENLLSAAHEIIKEELVTVYLNPEDYRVLQERFDDIHYDRTALAKLRFTEDSSTPRGDVRIESPLGLLNFDIRRQLDDLQTKVLEVRQQS